MDGSEVKDYTEEQIRKETIHALMQILRSDQANSSSKASAARTLAEISKMIGKNVLQDLGEDLDQMSITDLDKKIASLEHGLKS